MLFADLGWRRQRARASGYRGHDTDAFWPLLEAFDPDHWAAFRRTARSERIKDPLRFEKELSEKAFRWASSSGRSTEDGRRWFLSDPLLDEPIEPIRPSPAVNEEIRSRFAPLIPCGEPVQQWFMADRPPPRQLVDMCQLTYRPTTAKALEIPAVPLGVQLLVAATTGQRGPSHREWLGHDNKLADRVVRVAAEDVGLAAELAWARRVDETQLRAQETVAAQQGRACGFELPIQASWPIARSSGPA